MILNIDQQIDQEQKIKVGQKYRFLVINEIVTGIECLICGHCSYDKKDVYHQQCRICNISHKTLN